MRRRTKQVLWWYGAGAIALLIAGAAVRAVFDGVPWTRTATYVAPTVTSTSPVASLEPLAERGSAETIAAPLPPPPISSLEISDTTIEQSDTFFVSVTNVPSGVSPTAAWSDRTYDLFRVGDAWVGFFGADAKKVVGNYAVKITMGTNMLTKAIAVAKRDFPVTVLAVTPELEAQGYTPPAIQSNVASENARLNAVLIYRPEGLFSRSFMDPLDRITIVGAYGNVRKSGAVELQHLGVDLDAPEGTPVYAINDGAVNLVEEFVNYGKTIVVDHGVGIFSFYLHLNEFTVKVGDRVARGQVIARSGNTGYSIGPHLHFSVRIRNASVDPLRFIETANAVLSAN